MIVAASTTLLADSRSGKRGGALPWALLISGSVASLAANVAVAEPTLIGRVIAAWPSFALTASYELLTRQVRRSAATRDVQADQSRELQPAPSRAVGGPVMALTRVQSGSRPDLGNRSAPGRDLQRQAWQWALANRASDGSLPSGSQIARQHGRRERWGRLVKRAGLMGELLGNEGDPSHVARDAVGSALAQLALKARRPPSAVVRGEWDRESM